MTFRRPPFPIQNSTRKRPYVKVTSKQKSLMSCLIYSLNNLSPVTLAPASCWKWVNTTSPQSHTSQQLSKLLLLLLLVKKKQKVRGIIFLKNGGQGQCQGQGQRQGQLKVRRRGAWPPFFKKNNSPYPLFFLTNKSPFCDTCDSHGIAA